MLRNKEELNKHELYFQAYCNTLKIYSEVYDKNPSCDFKPIIKKLIVYGVKVVNAKLDLECVTKEEAEKEFEFACIIKQLMGSLTPKEFMNLFPIAKDYKGHKYSVKDYFYTKNYINTLNQDKPIGDEMLHFLWDYHNWEITDFAINTMEYISNLRRLEGQPSLMEEFADTVGIKTYTMHTDDKGNQFLFDKESGKTTKLTKPKPRYLKLLK